MQEEGQSEEESEDDPASGAEFGDAATDLFFIESDDAVHGFEEEGFLAEDVGGDLSEIVGRSILFGGSQEFPSGGFHGLKVEVEASDGVFDEGGTEIADVPAEQILVLAGPFREGV